MKLKGRNVDTDHVTGIRLDAGTINGSDLTKTGQSILEKSLYQDQELGEDGRKRERKERKNDGVIEVAPVTKGEQYQSINK